MDIENENNKELNLLTPLTNILNSIISLNQQKIFENSNNNSEENKSNNILLSFNDDIKFCFKVLIFDESTFKFICPLLKQSSLKRNNICLTTKLNCQKDKMDDVMAIYLVDPTLENFKLILEDMKLDIYQNYSINFIEKPDDNFLDNFLINITKLGKYKQIYNLHVFPIKYSLIHPKIIDFCSLDDKIVNPYSLHLSDKINESYFELISNMIFNCLFCLRMSPLVKYRKNSICGKIVNKIQNKFNSVFNKFPNLQKEFQNSNCLLILLERKLLDIPIMLHHPCSYGAMMNDLCGLTFDQYDQSNIRINNKAKFNLDPLNDFIWNESIISPYHEVGDETLKRYKKYNENMKILENGNKKTDMLKYLESNSEEIEQSLKTIDKKKMEGDILDKNANFSTILNKNIEQRHLGEIYVIEKSILDKREVNEKVNKNIKELIEEKKINNNNYLDIFRLSLIYYYFVKDSDNNNKKFIKEIIDKLSLSSSYNSKAIIEYFDLLKKEGQNNSSEQSNEKSKEEQNNKTMLNQLGGAIKNKVKKGFNLITNAVVNLAFADSTSIAMDILDDLIYNGKRDKEEFYHYQLNKNIYIPIKSSSYQNIFFFSLGGGSLNEFEYCKEYIDKRRLNNFFYGADKIYSPTEFLEELNQFAINNMTLKRN